MPWCPKCKLEYREGITECSDCKVELVEELKEKDILIPFLQSEQKDIAEKLVEYFEYSGLNASISFDEEHRIHLVLVPEKKMKTAKKLYQAFYFVEREKQRNNSDKTSDTQEEGFENPNTDDERLLEEDDVDIFEESDEELMEEDEDSSSTTYVMKADQYKDLSSTVWIFTLLGLLGLIFVVLNAIDVIQFLNGTVPIISMGLLFLFFLYIGFTSYKKAQVVKSEIEAEHKLTSEINQWLKDNVTESFIATIRNNDVSEELNYLQLTDTIKRKLNQTFGKQNSNYLDQLIEEYYNNHME